MNGVRTLSTGWRRATAVVLAALCLATAMPSAAWAQGSKKEPTPEELKGYTLPYFFAFVAVLAVVVVVCRPAGRSWDIEPEDDDAL